MSRILVSAGGTGGHVFPALAVAKALQANGHDVVWVGTADRIEARVVPEAGFTFHGLPLQPLRGKGVLGLLKAPFNLLRALRACARVVKAEAPDLVIGFGGYTAGPVGVVARQKGIPLVVHEQNAIPGLTNKLLAKIATRTLLGFADAKVFLGHADVTGNPVRDDICALHSTDAITIGSPLRILVIGGSLGAQHLNQTVPAALARWCGPALKVRHQVGAGRAAEVTAEYQEVAANVDVQVDEFIQDMAAAYQAADIVIGRAGALTVAELSMAGKASILVPYPHAVDDHQTANAHVLSNRGAALLLPQPECSATRLCDELKVLANAPEHIKNMAANARREAPIAATAKIVALCEALMVERKDV
ncbi:undecaprenyldiphospho-muramoylpentapeptide beta-N-acetylglucosaminyltransferase [Aliidiomarina indica]|uniref:undecaprenyldiphospho-muramoylpentapeptide beta-N-acetylglucosaminyltransferase n=1 Tax=Aliidiomarina indica TaxID=2749147 RepID=UPI00188F8E57|nr:undecaprenyldiphospho-muramoylpentapeptide beta-N-acetylglucosaminyltransferase [Aliidiomarina indica]